MAMQKAYIRTKWYNKPSDKSPINERNLNNIEVGIDTIDNRVISLDTSKFEKSEAQTLVHRIDYNRTNGVFTITYYNGTTAEIDTMLEKLAVNFDYSYQTQQLIITLDDGTRKYVDLRALLTQYEFLDSDTIDFQVQPDGKVTAIVKEGSIQEKHLRPNYLADIKVEVAKSQASAAAAKDSEIASKKSELASKNSEEKSKASELASKDSEEKSKASELASKDSEEKSKASELASKDSEEKSKASELASKDSEEKSKASELASKDSEEKSKASELASASSASISAYNVKLAQSWTEGDTGIRKGENFNNSKYFAKMAEQGAARSGWLRFRINNKGQLVMYKRGINDIKFVMRNGILEVILGWKKKST